MKNVKGYQIEASSDDAIWHEKNMVRARQPAEGLRHEAKVEGLDSDTEYKFRIRVVARNGKNGESGPEVAARTTCGSKHSTKISFDSLSIVRRS